MPKEIPAHRRSQQPDAQQPEVKPKASENREPVRARSAPCSVGPKWEGNPKKRGHAYMGIQVALLVKNLPVQETSETQVQSLGWEDPLEEGTATHSRILAWRILWTEEFGRLQSIGSHGVRHD